MSDLNTGVVSCFEVKPRRRCDKEDIVRNEDGTFAADRKAFRLCVYDDDRDRVMDAAVWPDSVMVSEWFFKARGDDVNRRQQASDRVNDKQPVRLTAASPTRTAHQAAASSASSSPATGCGDVAPTDDNTGGMQAASSVSVVAVLRDDNDDTVIVTEMSCDDGDN